jgi:sirohydrochlorin ferrochelatase
VTDLNEPVPPPGDSLPRRGGPLVPGAADLPRRRPLNDPDGEAGPPLPRRGGKLPQRGDSLPQRGDSLQQRGDSLQQRGDSLPQRADSLQQRGGPADGGQPLPRRTTRSRRPGRHRSPHRLSVASDAPALVLAVPGTAEADTAGIGPTVASLAELSCPGVEILVGYVEGHESPISDCLAPTDPRSADGENQFPRVVVPLLLSPSVRFDGAIRRAVAESAVPVVLASHLGPHPLVAEALHSRLAEAGLARVARSTGLSISAESQGIVVLADVGEEATSAAAVAAVLLASRLSVPVVPASLGDPASIVNAVDRLTESGSRRPVLAPCLIGPETSTAVLADLSAALGAPCAPVLGAHKAVGQLVAVRYGAALASLTPTG